MSLDLAVPLLVIYESLMSAALTGGFFTTSHLGSLYKAGLGFKFTLALTLKPMH